MSIFEAELRRGIPHEDYLTSKVFGLFDIVKPLLREFLKEIHLSKIETPIKINFWKSFGTRTPDVIITGKNLLVFIEAKLSKIDINQLVDEYRMGIEAQQRFRMVVITPDIVIPQEFYKSIEKLKSCLLYTSPSPRD